MRPVVHIVDDDAPFRASIGRLLRLSGFETAEHESADQLLRFLADDGDVGCILLDVKLPGLSGPELQDRLVELGSHLPIVFVTGHGDIPTTVRAMKAGAEDFLTKPVSREDLVDSIRRAMARNESERPEHEWLRSARTLLDSLTPREREVLEFVVRGQMNKQTAHALGITERTIKAHRQRIFEKIGVRTIAELVSFAERLGILTKSRGAETGGKQSAN